VSDLHFYICHNQRQYGARYRVEYAWDWDMNRRRQVGMAHSREEAEALVESARKRLEAARALDEWLMHKPWRKTA